MSFVREPNNAHSCTAVAVNVAGKQIGYVPENYSGRVTEYLTGGYEWTSRILDIHGGDSKKQSLGVTLEAAFWRGARPARDPFREGYENNNAARLARGAPTLDSPRPPIVSDGLIPGVKNSIVVVMLFVAGTVAAAFLVSRW